MLYDYDLVVIGDSVAGRWAALAAAQSYARVAWVQQAQSHHLGLAHAVEELCDHWKPNPQKPPYPTLQDLGQAIEQRRQILTQPYDSARLSQIGVDVILDTGQFLPRASSSKTQPMFEVQSRQLRSPKFLLAPDFDLSFLAKTSEGVKSYQNLVEFIQTLPQQPQSITVKNQGVEAILAAQLLNAFDYPSTLAQTGSILGSEDSDVSFFLQTYLEAQGIQLTSAENQTFHESTTQTGQEKWLSTLHLDKLSLPPCSSQSRKTLEYLPPFIDACGTLWGGYNSARLALKEAQIVLNNLRSQQHHTINYSELAYSLPILPNLHRIGLTETQACRQHSIVKCFQTAQESYIQGGTAPLFCKVVALQSGQILGVHILGISDPAIAHLLETIIKEQVTVTDLNQWGFENPVLHSLFQNLSLQGRRAEPVENRDRQEKYFRRKRKQFS